MLFDKCFHVWQNSTSYHFGLWSEKKKPVSPNDPSSINGEETNCLIIAYI